MSNSIDGMLGNELETLCREREAVKSELDSHRRRYADEILNGGVGEDMMSVLDGKKKIEVKGKTKAKYRFLDIINRLFKAL